VREAAREGCRGAPRALPMQLTSMAFSQELCRQPNAPLSAASELLTFRFLKRDPHAPGQRMPFIPALPGGIFWHVFVKGISFNLDDIQNCKQVKGIGKLLTGDPLYAVLKRNMPISGGQANLIGRKKYPPLSL
ncbi:MAG: hypothetical protein JSW15_01435, partial [Deltaproteobacteria bacterium]